MVALIPSLVPSLVVLWVVGASLLPHNRLNKPNPLSKRIDAFAGSDGPTIDPPSEHQAALAKKVKDAQNRASIGGAKKIAPPDVPQWVGRGPAPEWAIPGPENPEGNPYYPNIDYPKPPDGASFDDCKKKCLDWVKTHSDELPWIYNPEVYKVQQLWPLYCIRRCGKIHVHHHTKTFIPRVEHPTRDPPPGKDYVRCKKFCIEWYDNPLYWMNWRTNVDPAVVWRCEQHCSAFHSHKGYVPTKNPKSAPPTKAPPPKRGSRNNLQNLFEGARSKFESVGFGDALWNTFHKVSDKLHSAVKQTDSGFVGLPRYGPLPLGVVIP